MTDISLKTLLETNAHFGHQVKRWNPKMASYIYGQEAGIHIFDLAKTKTLLEEAIEFLKTSKKEGKVILFLGTKKQAKDKLTQVAKNLNSPYVNERFLGGTITNFDQIKKSTSKLAEMNANMVSGGYDKYTKKERLLIKREIDRLERFFGGMKDMTKLPDVLFVIDTHKEIGAVKEANKRDIPVVGIVDTNSDPTLVDYPIPMNDDSSKAIDYVLDVIEEALSGKVKETKTIEPKVKAVKKVAKKVEKKETPETKKGKTTNEKN